MEISKRRLQQTLHMKIEYEPCHMHLSSLCNYRDSDAGTKMEFLCRGCQCRVHTGVCSACLLRALLDLRNKIRRLKTESEAIEDRMRHRLEHKVCRSTDSFFAMLVISRSFTLKISFIMGGLIHLMCCRFGSIDDEIEYSPFETRHIVFDDVVMLLRDILLMLQRLAVSSPFKYRI